MKRARQVATLVGTYAALYLCKEPRHTSDYTGLAWVDEILRGHPDRCYDMFRMETHVFLQLCTELQSHGLCETRRVGVHEQVAIFLNSVGHELGSRILEERFQHSGETLHRHFHSVLEACCRLAMSNIKPLDPVFKNVHTKITSSKYWPFFKKCYWSN